jgi:hypothetical protein
MSLVSTDAQLIIDGDFRLYIYTDIQALMQQDCIDNHFAQQDSHISFDKITTTLLDSSIVVCVSSLNGKLYWLCIMSERRHAYLHKRP